MGKYLDYDGVKYFWQKALAKFAPLTSLNWTYVNSFTTTAKQITIGDCHEVMVVASMWNNASKTSMIMPPSEFAASTWYKVGGAYRNSSTNMDAEFECSAVSGIGTSSAKVTLKISAAYVNGGDRSSTSTFKVYTR